MNYHRDRGSDNDLDPASRSKASYTPDLLAELGEPLPDVVNGYRQAAICYLGIMFAVDQINRLVQNSITAWA